jgi:hypothetical protein
MLLHPWVDAAALAVPPTIHPYSDLLTCEFP